MTEEDLARCLADRMWRLCSGRLYKIMVKRAAKNDEEAETFVMPFKLSRARRRLFASRLRQINVHLGSVLNGNTNVMRTANTPQ